MSENIFGLTPAARRMLKIGFAILVGFQVVSIVHVSWLARRTDGDFVTPQARMLAPSEGQPGRLAAKARLDAELERLSSLRPGEARCFRAAERYRVGDRGLRKLKAPNPALVETFAGGGEAESSSEILPERYLGFRLRSIRAVESAGAGGGLDSALRDYVMTRKAMLEVMHRFFGRAGLELMRGAYEGRADAAVLDRLRNRLEAGAPALRADGPLLEEIGLLLASPRDFLPCLARAEIGRPGDTGGRGLAPRGSSRTDATGASEKPL